LSQDADIAKQRFVFRMHFSFCVCTPLCH